MEHLIVKATEVETNEQTGSFVALVSTFGIDRQGEQVMPGAFRATLARWRKSGQMIPVMADHEDEIHAVVGAIDPRLTAETAQGLEATGTIDTSTELGARVHALLKKSVMSWSIGFIVPEGGRRKRGKVTEITEIDLAEVSVVSVPANAGVRTLSIKSATTTELPEEEAEILRTLRAEWEAKREAKAEEKERKQMQHTIYHMPGLNDEEPDDSPISVCGALVRPSNIHFDR